MNPQSDDPVIMKSWDLQVSNLLHHLSSDVLVLTYFISGSIRFNLRRLPTGNKDPVTNGD